MVTLLDFLCARLADDERDAEKLLDQAGSFRAMIDEHSDLLLGRLVPGWWAWPSVEAACRQRLDGITAIRAVLALHEQFPCSNCEAKGRHPATSCLRCHHGEPDRGESFYDGMCAEVRALAQPYAGHPEFLTEWKA